MEIKFKNYSYLFIKSWIAPFRSIKVMFSALFWLSQIVIHSTESQCVYVYLSKRTWHDRWWTHGEPNLTISSLFWYAQRDTVRHKLMQNSFIIFTKFFTLEKSKHGKKAKG